MTVPHLLCATEQPTHSFHNPVLPTPIPFHAHMTLIALFNPMHACDSGSSSRPHASPNLASAVHPSHLIMQVCQRSQQWRDHQRRNLPLRDPAQLRGLQQHAKVDRASHLLQNQDHGAALLQDFRDMVERDMGDREHIMIYLVGWDMPNTQN
jgi:hypothetical protein